MQAITDYMSADHQRCDNLFAEAEAAAAKNDLAATVAGFNAFHQAMVHHLTMEENIMFPAIEEATGMYMSGPTRIMRMEHGQMRGLFEDIEAALNAEDTHACAGLMETLLVLMQQHNMKEEQMLYPMADRSLKDSDKILKQMEKMQ
ncbi:MAG: hemerythrin domain-containing protein [Gallionellaceae bacterium]|nr:hemerythrin domain-containing protein [Gallionellaceae bacterium]